MKRALALLDHALGAMGRRAGRSASIALALALVVALASSTLFVADALAAEHAALVATMPDLSVQRLVAGRPALVSRDDVRAVEGLSGVRSVRARVWGYVYVGALEANAVVVGVAPTETTSAAVSGRWPREEREVVLGPGLARALGARVDDVIVLTTRLASAGEVEPVELVVVGIARGETSLVASDVVLATDAGAARLLDVPPGMATDLVVDLVRDEEAPVVTDALAASIPGVRVIDRTSASRTWELTRQSRAGFVSAMLLPALLALLLLAWDRLTGLAEEEAREIGILKAVGWATGDVIAVRMIESALIALVGASAGLALGYVHAFVLGAPGLWDAIVGWSALHAEARLTPALHPTQIWVVLASVVVPFVAVSVVPAWRAAMLDPERAMRGGGAP